MGKDSGGGGAYPVSTQTKGQRDLLDSLTSLLGGQLGQGVSPYGGQMVAPPSGLQEQGFDFYGNLGQNLQQYAQFDPAQSFSYLNQGSNALGGMLGDYDPTSAQQFWKQSMVNPAMRSFQQDVLPQINERYARGGANSGAFDRAVARAGSDLSSDLGAQLGGLLYQGQQAHLGRQQQGINQALGYAMAPGDIYGQGANMLGQAGNVANAMLNAGQIQRGIGQQGLGAEYQNYMQSQAYNNPWLQYLSPALGTQAIDYVVEGGSPDMMSGFLGPAAGAFLGTETGAGMFGSLLSGALGGGGAASGWVGPQTSVPGFSWGGGIPF